jgi:hypothetical protein
MLAHSALKERKRTKKCGIFCAETVTSGKLYPEEAVSVLHACRSVDEAGNGMLRLELMFIFKHILIL